MLHTLRIICVLAALATLVIMVLVGDFLSPHLVVLFLVFAVVVNAPYILGWILAGKLRDEQTGLALFAIAVAAAAGFGLWAYWWTFFAERQKDAQDGLVFVVLPVYQSGGILAAFLLAKLIGRFRR